MVCRDKTLVFTSGRHKNNGNMTEGNSSESYINETVCYLNGSEMREGLQQVSGPLSPRPPPQRQGTAAGKSKRHARHSYPCDSPSSNRTGSALSGASQLWISGRTSFEQEMGEEEGEEDEVDSVKEDSESSFDQNTEMEEELSRLCQDENGDFQELDEDESSERDGQHPTAVRN